MPRSVARLKKPGWKPSVSESFLAGEALAERLSKFGRLSRGEEALVASEIARAVAASTDSELRRICLAR